MLLLFARIVLLLAQMLRAFVEMLLSVCNGIVLRLEHGGRSTGALAGEMALSRSWLYRKVREEFGVSPNQLIQRIRLERAAQLLKEQAGNISEVAYAVGFNSLSYFNRCFRAHFDVAPSAYLRAQV